MGLFRNTTSKKIDKRDVDPSYHYDNEEDFEIGSVPPEVTTGGRRSSSSRSLSRWFGGGGGGGGSSSLKRSSKKKEKTTNNNNKERSSSSSTSSSEYDNTRHHDHENGNSNNNNCQGRLSSQRERGGPPPTRQGMQMFQASQLKSKITEASNESGMLGSTTAFPSTHQHSRRQQDELANSVCSLPPAAKVAAFEGPARFDWIDVEYSAVTKIQSIFRRHLVLQELEEEGLSTSYIRNRKRQRKATPMVFHSSKVDEAAPDLGFGCCSIGLAFGGNHELDEGGDTAAYRDFQRKKYEEKARGQAEHEEFLRQSYLKRQGLRDSVQKLAESKSRDELLRP